MAPLGLLSRLRDYWPYGKSAEPPPPLSTSFAVTLTVVLTVLYVAPFYLSSTTRPSPTITRDSPTVINARIRAVMLSCSFSTIITVYILSVPGRLPFTETLHLLGLWPIAFADIARAMLLIISLYAGPLFEHIVVEEAWRDYLSNPGQLLSKLSSPIGFRNYIAGPFTEELLFRSIIIPLNILTPQVTQASTGLAGTHARLVLFTTPLYFGVAHIHHLYEFRLTRPELPFKFALFQSLFQLCFTTIFGWYAAFIFLRTGSLWACCLTHAFCNWMGLPRLWGKVERPAPTRPSSFSVLKTGPPKAPVAMGPPKDEPGISVSNANGSGAGKRSHAAGRARSSSYVRTRSQSARGGRDDSILWSVAYYVILASGMIGFYKGLWPLTQSQAQLAAI